MIPVDGVAGFGLQCPYGSVGAPQGAKIQLWDCPISMERVGLTKPLEALFLSADCKKKFLSVRMDKRRMDSNWEVLPDGSFFATVDGGTATLLADGPGRGECTTALTADVSGKLECNDQDKVTIRLETVWWMNKPFDTSMRIDGKRCEIPSSCYMYSAATLHQCQ